MDNIEVRKAIEFIVNENGGMSGASRNIYVFGNIDDLDLSSNLIRVKTVCNNEAYINLRYVSMITRWTSLIILGKGLANTHSSLKEGSLLMILSIGLNAATTQIMISK